MVSNFIHRNNYFSGFHQNTIDNQTSYQKLETSISAIQNEFKTSDTLAFFYTVVTFVAGTIIVIIVSIGQSRQSKKIEAMTSEISILVSKVKEMLDVQDKHRKRRYDSAIDTISSGLALIEKMIFGLEEWKKGKRPPKDSRIIIDINFFPGMINARMSDIVQQLSVSADLLEPVDLDRINRIIFQLKINYVPYCKSLGFERFTEEIQLQIRHTLNELHVKNSE